MATDMTKISQQQQSIVNQIIQTGRNIGASDRVIQAAVNIANAESDLGVNLRNPTSTAYGLFHYIDETWDASWNKFVKLNPSDPMANRSADDARDSAAAQIKVMYMDLNRREDGYDDGIIIANYKPGNDLYPGVTFVLQENGIDIVSDFLSYCYLVHNTDPYQIIDVTNSAFTAENLLATNSLVDAVPRPNQSISVGPLWIADDLLSFEHDYSLARNSGLVTDSFWNTFTDWSSNNLVSNTSSYTFSTGYTFDYSDFGFDPIDAFYESTTPANDPALSIAGKTAVLLNATNQGVSATQLAGLDANHDGKLSGSELGNLLAWADRNENGVMDVGEVTSLALAGINEVRSGDYSFYTRGNSRMGATATAPARPNEYAAVPVLAESVPGSNYRTLRDTDNMYPTFTSYILWQPNQIKLNWGINAYDTMVGTDGNDSFDVNYFASTAPSLNLSNHTVTIRNFLAGPGDDIVGGSTGDDHIWGGTGNDTLWGYAGTDRLYGEEGNDALVGGDGSDILFGGAGSDVLWGGNGADTLVGGDDSDTLLGEDGNDTLFGGMGNFGSWKGSTSTAPANWYYSSQYQLEQIQVSNGASLASPKVDNLVQAMASFAPPAPGQTTMPPNYQTALAPVIAANWH